MSLVINTNLASLNAQRQLLQSGRTMDTAMERLASGKRINSAADDAAGLSMSSRMTSQTRGLDQAVRNANDGISLIQVAEAALGESTSILQRMRELSIQSANGIYNDADRGTLNAEFLQLVTELDRIADTTEFNGRSLLNGTDSQISLQVGAESEQTIAFSIPATNVDNLGLSSQSGDLIGTQMEISGTGGLTNALEFSAVKINDQTLSGLSAGASVQSLLDEINTSIEGVSAASLTQISAADVGTGVLQGSDTLVISSFLLDGSQQSFTISNTTSLEAMVDAINNQTGTLISASIGDDGRLSLSSQSMARISVQDNTQGIATGINIGVIADADIATVVEGLTSYWVSEAENLITSEFGITGLGNLTLNLATSDGLNGNLASVTFTTVGGVAQDLFLNIDMADYVNVTLSDGDSATATNLDRVIAHELVHAVMAVNMDMSDTGDDGTRDSDGKDSLPGWFTEGAAELIHGADDRVNGDIGAGHLDNQGELNTAFADAKGNGSPTLAGSYSASYLATKMLHDDILAATGGANGINLIFDELQGGASLDEAITTVAANTGVVSWSNRATFETDFETTGFAYMGSLNLGNADTGSIAGSDYGGPALDEDDVLANNNTGPAQDFSLIIPSQYSGGLSIFSAQLVLTSDDGSDITVTKAINGTDASLQSLGFREVQAVGEVIGQGLDASEQSTALISGDLLINGIDIGAVESSAGLMGKIDAINALRSDTGVTASVTAEQSFSHSTDSSTALISGTAVSIGVGQDGVLGLNGVGIAITVGDSAQDISASINAATVAHGVTAYSDDAGKLHLYSGSVINASVNNAGITAALGGLVDSGAGGDGSITINGNEITLSNLSNSQTIINELNSQSSITGVGASIDNNGEIKLKGTSAVQISLGNTNGVQTLAALGITFGVSGGENLTDSNNNNRLGDDSFTIESRIKLDSFNDQTISVEVTTNGAAATGLGNLNIGTDGLFGSAISSLNISTAASAQISIDSIDNALNTVSDARSDLGAINNRLSFAVNNLANISQNTAAARSQIVDADFAMETASLGRAQVLQQASQAMLAQANSSPQQVLALLQ